MQDLRAKRSRDEEAERTEVPQPFPLNFFPPGVRFFDFHQSPSSSDSEDDSDDGEDAWGHAPFEFSGVDLSSLPFHDVFARALASGPPQPLPFVFPPFSFARMLSSTIASLPSHGPPTGGSAGRGRAARSSASGPPPLEPIATASRAGRGKGSKGGGRAGRTPGRGAQSRG